MSKIKMNNISILLPKNQRPVWIDNLQDVETQVSDMSAIPLLGTITAGNPIERIEHRETVDVPPIWSDKTPML